MSYHTNFAVDLSKPPRAELIDNVFKAILHNLGTLAFATLSESDCIFWGVRTLIRSLAGAADGAEFATLVDQILLADEDSKAFRIKYGPKALLHYRQLTVAVRKKLHALPVPPPPKAVTDFTMPIIKAPYPAKTLGELLKEE